MLNLLWFWKKTLTFLLTSSGKAVGSCLGEAFPRGFLAAQVRLNQCCAVAHLSEAEHSPGDSHN